MEWSCNSFSTQLLEMNYKIIVLHYHYSILDTLIENFLWKSFFDLNHNRIEDR